MRHPLQPFDPRNFTPARSCRPAVELRPRHARGRARADRPRAPSRAPFLAAPLPAARRRRSSSSTTSCASSQHPVRAFLRQRLGISVGDYSDEVEDALPVELDGLEQVGRRRSGCSTRGSAGVDARAAILAEIARGTLPPGVLGKPVIDEVLPDRRARSSPRRDALRRPARRRARSTCASTLADGRTLSGTVPGVARRRAAHRHLLAGRAQAPARGVGAPARADRRAPGAAVRGGRRSGARRRRRAVAVARSRRSRRRRRRRRPRSSTSPTLVDLYDRGMREPLPLYCKTSAAYADAAAAGADAVAAGRKAVGRPSWNFDQGGPEPEHQLVLGGVRTFDELLGEPPRADEQGDGWDADETTRFGRYARRLWDGLLACEEVTTGERRDRRAPFDVCGPLPTGVTVLEASAGTGKTYTIAALAARYVAEGTPLDAAAARDLHAHGDRRAARARARAARQRRARARRARSPARAPPATTRSSRCSPTGPTTRSRLRRDRLAARSPTSTPRRSPPRTASARRCSAASASPATSSRDVDVRRGPRRPRRGGRRRPLRAPLPRRRRRRRSTAREARADRARSRSPTRPRRSSRRRARRRVAGDAPPARRGRARGARARASARLAVMTYDDLLTRLDDALAGDGGAAAAARLRERYRVVLVDEFQDTDPVQWEIMRRAFGDGDGDARPDRRPEAGDLRLPRRRRLRLPRGRADAPATQRDARRQLAQRPGADRRLRRAVRRRAARPRGHRLPAASAPPTPTSAPRLSGAPVARAAARAGRAPRRAVDRAHARRATRRQRAAREHIAEDLAADVVALLSSGASSRRAPTTARRAPRARAARRTSRCSCRRNRDAALVRDALDAAGVPAVINGAGSVFATAAGARVAAAARGARAPDLAAARALGRAHLLPRLDAPSRSPRADDDEWEEVHRRLHDWARVLRVAGVASLLETITLGRGPARAGARATPTASAG